MRPGTEQHSRAVLLALSGLSAAEVRQTAAQVPPPLRTLLERLAEALESADPKAALTALLAEIDADPAVLQEQIARTEDLVGTQLTGLRQALHRMAAPLEGLSVPRVPDDLDDPALTAILSEALQLTGEVDLAALMRDAIAEGSRITDDLAEAMAAARQDPQRAARATGAVQDRIHHLQDTLQKLESIGDTLPGALGLLGKMRMLAEKREHPVAVEIALAEAALQDARGELPPRILQEKWRDALSTALRHQALPQARQAAQRIQLIAISRNDPAPAAVAAGEVATLARALGVRRAEVLALLEESLILAGIHERRQDALRRLRAALSRAEGQDSALQARVRLSAGQTLERLGEHGEARRTWRALVQQPDGENSHPAELGRALLYIGRQEARRGKRDNARKILDNARRIGQRTGDWMLYAPALIALLEDRVDANDIAGAGALIREARQLAPYGGERAVEALEGMVSFLKGQWGAETVDNAITGSA